MRKFKKLLLSITLGVLISVFIGCTSNTQTNVTSSNNGTTSSNNDIIVYVTKTGEKYHNDSCMYLKKSKISITLNEAKKEGYTPCSKCNPPR